MMQKNQGKVNTSMATPEPNIPTFMQGAKPIVKNPLSINKKLELLKKTKALARDDSGSNLPSGRMGYASSRNMAKADHDTSQTYDGRMGLPPQLPRSPAGYHASP